MPTNHYFQDGRMIGESEEQNLVEDLIIESIRMYGIDLFYLPRTVVNKDELFLEDTLSKFKQAIPIEAYLESVNGFGENDVLSKFGIQLNDSGTFVIARRRWEQLVGQNTGLQLPNRPAEGDIVFFPKTRSYFEIKKVEVMNPFYQLGRLYTYKLQVELFSYSSERFETGVPEIDNTGTLYQTGDIIANPTAQWETDEVLISSDNDYFKDTQSNVISWSGNNPFGENDI